MTRLCFKALNSATKGQNSFPGREDSFGSLFDNCYKPKIKEKVLKKHTKNQQIDKLIIEYSYSLHFSSWKHKNILFVVCAIHFKIIYPFFLSRLSFTRSPDTLLEPLHQFAATKAGSLIYLEFKNEELFIYKAKKYYNKQ